MSLKLVDEHENIIIDLEDFLWANLIGELNVLTANAKDTATFEFAILIKDYLIEKYGE